MEEVGHSAVAGADIEVLHRIKFSTDPEREAKSARMAQRVRLRVLAAD
jgi:hypothetical protein